MHNNIKDKEKDKLNSEIERINEYYDNIIGGLLGLKDLVSTYVDIKERDLEGFTAEEIIIFLKARIREKHDLISDLLLSIANIQVDLAICHRYLLIAKVSNRPYEEIYFARALATHLFELFKIENQDKLSTRLKNLGSEFREQKYQDIILELKKHRKKLENLYHDNRAYIDTLRNKLFAHRETKGIDEHNSIKSIDVGSMVHISEPVEVVLHDISGNLITLQAILTPLFSGKVFLNND
jgi:hypothetical protein